MPVRAVRGDLYGTLVEWPGRQPMGSTRSETSRNSWSVPPSDFFFGGIDVKVGERQSTKVDIDNLIVTGGQYPDLYESNVHLFQDRPLDTGRLLYAKLRMTLPEHIGVEVYWNHFTNRITAEIKTGRNSDYELSFKEEPMSRGDRLIQIQNLVDTAQEAIAFQQ
jgi:hypothetical protein